MLRLLVLTGTAIPLNPEKRPNSYWSAPIPADVARVEDQNFHLLTNQRRCRPDQQLGRSGEDEAEAGGIVRRLHGWAAPCTWFPTAWAPIGSPMAKIGVEITDSPYVVASMHIMARWASHVLDVLGERRRVRPRTAFDRRSRSARTSRTHMAAATPSKSTSAIFRRRARSGPMVPVTAATRLLGKKCHALRIASVQARDEGWMAEHMLILKLISPSGQVKYMTGAFPSACGKTNLSMLIPTIPGWKVETIGDDIAWMKFGADGRLYAINPEYGFFGVAPARA